MRLEDIHTRMRKKARGSQRAMDFVNRVVIREDQLLRVVSFDRIRARVHTWDGKNVRVFNEADFLSASIRPTRSKNLKLSPEDQAVINATLEGM